MTKTNIKQNNGGIAFTRTSKLTLNNIVYSLFFLTVFFILLNRADNVSFSYQLQWFKYVYIAVMLVVNIVYVRIEKIHTPVVIFLGLIFLHTFLFCFVLTNASISSYTQEHLKNTLIFYAVVILTARYCHWSGTRFQFLVVSFFAFMAFILWCYFTHFSGFAPFRYLLQIPGIISGTVDYGFDYGTGSYNNIANIIACALVLLCCIFLYREQLNGGFKKYQKVIWLVCTVFLFLMLVSTTGRAEIIVITLFGLIILFLFWLKKKIHLAKNKAANFVLLIALTIGLIALIVWFVNFTLSEGTISNRNKNLTVNFEAFKEYGNWLFGMGYAESYAFLRGVYEYTTFACDVYYLYYFFSTGIVGVTLIGLSLVYLAYQIFFGKVKDKKFKYIMMALLIMSLVNGMYHVCINNYYYCSCYIYTTLFIVYLYEVEPRKKKRSIHVKF